jgi:hypothetical protein
MGATGGRGRDRGRGHRGDVWGDWAWWLDLLANFPLQYAVLFLALAVGQAIMRQRVAWGSLALCVSGHPIIPTCGH